MLRGKGVSMADINPVFGIQDCRLPLVGFPKGRKRISIRAGEYATVAVRPPEGGVRVFHIDERRGAWHRSYEIGRNVEVG